MTTVEIVRQYLEANGYDGLGCNECGCEISDLVPCGGESFDKCEASYKIPCDPETCQIDGDCEWHMSQEKPTDG